MTLATPTAPRSAAPRPEPAAARTGAPRDGREALWRAAAALVVVLGIATRLPFMTRTLYAFDSANFALAVQDFYNVAFHQPHPPGYPLYVGIAWVLNLAVHDANRSLVLEGILLGAVGLASTLLLGRALFGRAVGLTAGVLLLFTVGFWGYAEVAYAYVGLAAEMALLALLAEQVIAGRERLVLALGAAWAVSLGIRWDGAIFCAPLALWALLTVSWRLRLATVAIAAAIIAAFAIPMVQLSGGLTVYLKAVNDYLHVWAPQSSYLPGQSNGGGATLASYNLNFLVDYSRQMLGIGLLLSLYYAVRAFGPASLATDHRARFLLLWIVPPLLTYVFGHLGEAGYVLSLAPAAAVLAARALDQLRGEIALAASVLRARGPRARWLPSPAALGTGTAAVLGLLVVGWNVHAFLRGVGPGRLPDLRAHDATTAADVAFLRAQPAASTLVLSHDIFRQIHFYLPGYENVESFDEYVPNWQQARVTTPLSPSVARIVILEGPVSVPPADAARLREVQLSRQPLVRVWVMDARGARAVVHGYHFVSLVF